MLKSVAFLAVVATLTQATLQTCIASLVFANNSMIQVGEILIADLRGEVAGVDVNGTHFVSFKKTGRISHPLEILSFRRHGEKKCEEYTKEMEQKLRVRLFEGSVIETELLRDGHYQVKFLCMDDSRVNHPQEHIIVRAGAFGVCLVSLILYLARHSKNPELSFLQWSIEIAIHLVVMAGLEPFTLLGVHKNEIAKSNYYFYWHFISTRLLRHYLTILCVYQSLHKFNLFSFTSGKERIIKLPYRIILGVVFCLLIADYSIENFLTRDRHVRCQAYSIRDHRTLGTENLEDGYRSGHVAVDWLVALLALPCISVSRFLGLLLIQVYLRAPLACFARPLDARLLIDYAAPALALILAITWGETRHRKPIASL